MCIDSWWELGGIQNQQEKRRHDLSDGFAILGVWSQPRVLESYSIDSCQLRNEKGTSIIELKDDSINIISESVNINGINFANHKHNVGDTATSIPIGGNNEV